MKTNKIMTKKCEAAYRNDIGLAHILKMSF